MRKFLSIVTAVSIFALAFSAVFVSPAAAKGKDTPVCKNSIVDTAIAVNQQTGEFSTLIAAVSAAGLVKTLDTCQKDFTVFAPTDAAFAKLGLNAENIGSAFDKQTLRTILLYHIIKGKSYESGDVVARNMLKMWKGGNVGVSVTGEGVFLQANNSTAQIITVDVATDNGVIHIIDTVLLP